MHLSEREIRALAAAFGLRADRSQIGQAVWGVRTPAEPGKSEGSFLSHPIEIAQYVAQERKITLNEASRLVLSALREMEETSTGYSVFGDHRVRDSANFWEFQCILAQALSRGDLEEARDFQRIIGKDRVDVEKRTEGGWSRVQFE